MEVVKNTNNETVVKISGRWDTTRVSEYGKELEQILENAAATIIFECESLDYISSSGLRIFLQAQKKISSRGASLEIHHLKPEIREVFRITGFTSIFNIK